MFQTVKDQATEQFRKMLDVAGVEGATRLLDAIHADKYRWCEGTITKDGCGCMLALAFNIQPNDRNAPTYGDRAEKWFCTGDEAQALAILASWIGRKDATSSTEIAIDVLADWLAMQTV